MISSDEELPYTEPSLRYVVKTVKGINGQTSIVVEKIVIHFANPLGKENINMDSSTHQKPLAHNLENKTMKGMKNACIPPKKTSYNILESNRQLCSGDVKRLKNKDLKKKIKHREKLDDKNISDLLTVDISSTSDDSDDENDENVPRKKYKVDDNGCGDEEKCRSRSSKEHVHLSSNNAVDCEVMSERRARWIASIANDDFSYFNQKMKFKKLEEKPRKKSGKTHKDHDRDRGSHKESRKHEAEKTQDSLIDNVLRSGCNSVETNGENFLEETEEEEPPKKKKRKEAEMHTTSAVPHGGSHKSPQKTRSIRFKNLDISDDEDDDDMGCDIFDSPRRSNRKISQPRKYQEDSENTEDSPKKYAKKNSLPKSCEKVKVNDKGMDRSDKTFVRKSLQAAKDIKDSEGEEGRNCVQRQSSLASPSEEFSQRSVRKISKPLRYKDSATFDDMECDNMTDSPRKSNRKISLPQKYKEDSDNTEEDSPRKYPKDSTLPKSSKRIIEKVNDKELNRSDVVESPRKSLRKSLQAAKGICDSEGEGGRNCVQVRDEAKEDASLGSGRIRTPRRSTKYNNEEWELSSPVADKKQGFMKLPKMSPALQRVRDDLQEQEAMRQSPRRRLEPVLEEAAASSPTSPRRKSQRARSSATSDDEPLATPLSSCGDEKSPARRGRPPKGSQSPKRAFDNEEDESVPKKKAATPRSACKSLPRTPRTKEKSEEPVTPSSRKGSARKLLMTPSMPTCSRDLGTPLTPLQEAMTRLHVSAVPQSLPCRKTEFDNIYGFLGGKIEDGAGGCMYISGVPGTGKTATVRQVVSSLKCDAKGGELPEFKFVEVNGMRLTHPRQVYVQIWKSLAGEVLTTEQAQRMLEDKFTKGPKNRMSTVLLIDELDVLWTRRQDVIYNLLDWPAKAGSRLVVITIANTMDLPERLLMGRVTSRLGLTRLTFQPYTYRQLEEIVRARLMGIDAFDADAVQFVSRKVASVSGDARRALDICRRASEIAEQEGPSALVTIKHVDEALAAMTLSRPVQRIIKGCSLMERMMLQAVEADLRRTGLEETTFKKSYSMLGTLCSLEGLERPSATVAMRICMNLSSCRLLIIPTLRPGVHSRISLNLSADDLHYALRELTLSCNNEK